MYLTIFRLTRTTGHKNYFKRAMYKRMAWSFYGRARNCFGISSRYVHRALQHANRGRAEKKKIMKKLWEMRISAACKEHGVTFTDLMTVLTEANIILNRKVLADLAIYEPRTFQSLCQFCRQQSQQQGLGIATVSPPDGVVTRGML